VCGILAAAWCATASADVVRLKNGNVLRGEIVAESPVELTVRVNGGLLKIKRTTVAEVVRETPKRPAAAPSRADVSEAAIIGLVQGGRAREAAERLEEAALRSSAELRRVAGLAGNVWLAIGNTEFRAGRFREAAEAFEAALSFQPAWDRALERRFYDAALADVRTRLLEQGEPRAALARVRELRGGLPDDPVAAWLEGRIQEQLNQPAQARLAYAAAVGGAPEDEALDALRSRAAEAAAKGVPPGGTVDWTTATLPRPAALRSERFVIEHRNAAAAARLARAMRWHLTVQTARMGRLAGRFPPSVPIRVRLHVSAAGLAGKAEAWAGGHANSRFRGGNLETEEIELLQDSAQLLGSALPHELGHLMLARAIGPHERFPYALAEGFACQFEAPWKRRWYRRVVRAAHGSERLSAETLLRAREYPPASEVARFYAGALCVVEALTARGGMHRLVRFCERAGRGDPVDALMDMYELTPLELDALVAKRLRE
jgi:hypothetical protein